MKLRSILALAFMLAFGSLPALAQVTPGTSPLSIAKGGTAGATPAAARTGLGLVIGTNVEAWNTNLDCLAALATSGVLQRTGSGTCAALTSTQLTALLNLATASLPGALPAWPNNTTTFFRGDGTYATLNVAAIGGFGTGVATFLATPSSANLLAALTTSTGTGNAVFSVGPTFTGTITAAAATFSGTVNYTGAFQVSGNGMTFPASAATLTQTIASGATAMGTGAISSATCATVVTATATNTATTDVVTASFNGDPTAVTGYVPLTTGMLTIIAYPTANNANFKVCNNTGTAITPGAITINWRVVR